MWCFPLLWLACGGGEDPDGTVAERQREDLPPNVLIVLTDDQGLDKVGSYDAHPSPPPTPVIDALAARGVSFDRAYAYPSCSPARSPTESSCDAAARSTALRRTTPSSTT